MKTAIYIFFLFCITQTVGQRTIGLIDYQNPNADGYVLFTPIPSLHTYLIDKCGEKVHEWSSTYKPGLSVYLLPDGSLIRTGQTNNQVFSAGGNGGVIEKYDWNNNLVWSYVISDSTQCQHHDVMPLPNGNILAISWEMHDSAEAVENGKNPAQVNSQLWGEKILELQPIGTDSANIVWEWRAWDHLVQDFNAARLNYDTVSHHPELLNINYTGGLPANADWLHLNSVDYNPALDQVLLSSHNLCEVFVIDHSTTTAQAATHSGGNSGKGGDILYRWGNPQAYKRGTSTDKMLFGQHHCTWIPPGLPDAGKILIFNNGFSRPAGAYTSVDIIDPPIDINNQYTIGATTAFLPSSVYWEYTAPVPTDFYANQVGGVYPLSNRSFMITNGPKGTFFEIDSTKQTIWKYINPVNTSIMTQGSTPINNSVFRCDFYPTSYPAFTSQTLTPQGEIELNPIVPSLCDSIFSSINEQETRDAFTVYPNPASTQFTVKLPDAFVNSSQGEIEIYNAVGEKILSGKIVNRSSFVVNNELPRGIYFVKVSDGEKVYSQKVVVE